MVARAYTYEQQFGGWCMGGAGVLDSSHLLSSQLDGLPLALYCGLHSAHQHA